MITTEVIQLTPEFAKTLLCKNTKNRPVSEALVSKYALAIERGEWKLNGEPVIIFSDGSLGDGQHRCEGVIRAGIAIPTVLLRGIDPESFSTINTGKLRNAADTLAISGEVNSIRLSAAARAYLREKLKGRALANITTAQVVDCVRNHPHVRFWSNQYGTLKNARLFPASVSGILAVASEKHGIEIVESFFKKIMTGADLTERDPALILRERFINQTNVSRLSAKLARTFIVKALNAHLTGKRITFLRMSPDEKDPEIFEG